MKILSQDSVWRKLDLLTLYYQSGSGHFLWANSLLAVILPWETSASREMSKWINISNHIIEADVSQIYSVFQNWIINKNTQALHSGGSSVAIYKSGEKREDWTTLWRVTGTHGKGRGENSDANFFPPFPRHPRALTLPWSSFTWIRIWGRL